MVRHACPSCTMVVGDISTNGGSTCQACGSALIRAEWDPAATDDELIQDLRRAFGHSESGPGPAQSPAAVPLQSTLTSEIGLVPGSYLGEFELIEEIGRGGMGVVYRARQSTLGREVALKVLPPVLRRGLSSAKRFRNEAQAVARLRHGNIVPVYAQGEHAGYLYYAMELVDGISLDTAVHQEPQWLTPEPRQSPGGLGGDPGHARTRTTGGEPADPASRTSSRSQDGFRHVARMFAGAVEGLAHAHASGVVHRDIKPQNLLLGKDGRLRLTDFGLAHLSDQPHATVCGEIMGTAAYLAPEQARGDAEMVDERTDIYATGATLYEVLTRRRPFDGETREQILNAICTGEPRRPRSLDRSVPQDLETICLKAMARAPGGRYASASLLAEDLTRYAEGRPILARRAGNVEWCVKWARRHPAASAALATTASALLILGGWVHAGLSSRQAEVEELIRSSYEHLAYQDYRTPEVVADSIARAERTAADSDELAVTLALVQLGRSENEAAAARLREVVERSPGDVRASYMLAWALWRMGQRSESRAVFGAAESAGGPDGADGWFFRGLAAHFDQPDIAADSYRQASMARAREHQFYPQAVLHLARAYNQQLYVERRADVFEDADFGLRQLVEHGHYGSYPYYLLSISHRLSAEIMRESGTAEEAAVAARLDEALAWARKGQEVYPADERPVTAEAECLETMGRFEEAIEARTRALGLATLRLEMWEGYHYRWRLYWWLGDLDNASADLQECQEFDPSSAAYRNFYPTLIDAEWTQREGMSPASPELESELPGVRDVLWSVLALRFTGRSSEATRLLEELVPRAEEGSDPWILELVQYALGQRSFEQALNFAEGSESPRKLLGELHFHAAARAIGSSDPPLAMAHLAAAQHSFDGEQAYTYHGKTLWWKLRLNGDWPPWGQLTPARGRETVQSP